MVGLEGMMLPDRFIENVAYNRGTNLKIFTEISQTVTWLKD